MILTSEDLAKRWKCSRSGIYEMVASGRLKAFKVGNGYRFLSDEVERYEKGENNEDS